MDGRGGEGGVEGRFLSADWALFGANKEDELTLLGAFGERHRLETEGEGDLLYLELTSLGLNRRVTPLFFSDGTSEGVTVSNDICFCNASSASHTSIHGV